MTFTATTLDLKIVGGAVRDRLTGHESHDLDLVAIHPAGFDDLHRTLEDAGGEVVKRDDSTFTLRTKLPTVLAERFGEKFADIVLARVDGPSSDGRHPDWVRPGTLLDDLARRDFSCNAVAFDDLTGEFIDPHNGQHDLMHGILRFVGDPRQRIREDALRVLRALRFSVTKDLTMTQDTWDAVNSKLAADLLRTLPIERVDSELCRMFTFDSVKSMRLLMQADRLHQAIFRDGLHLETSLKVRNVAK